MINQYSIKAEREQALAQEKRYAECFPGWRQNNLPRCPRVVAGKRCYVGDGRNVPKCICQRYWHRIFDHARMWKTPEKVRVLTSEPYNVNLDDLMAFRDECGKLGLTVELYPYSPYNPGWTTMLLIRRSDQEARHDLIG